MKVKTRFKAYAISIKALDEKRGDMLAKWVGRRVKIAFAQMEGSEEEIKEGIVETRPGPCKGFDMTPKLAYYSFARLRGNLESGWQLDKCT